VICNDGLVMAQSTCPRCGKRCQDAVDRRKKVVKIFCSNCAKDFEATKPNNKGASGE
jgi:transcription elongation factor Elf1